MVPPFLLSQFQQLLQARYSHLKIWGQGPPVRENMGRLSFFLGLSNLNTSFPSATHLPEKLIPPPSLPLNSIPLCVHTTALFFHLY